MGRLRASAGLASLAAAALLTGACGGGDDEADSAGTRPAASQPQTGGGEDTATLSDRRGDTSPAGLDIVGSRLAVDRDEGELSVGIDLAAPPTSGDYSAMLTCDIYMWQVGHELEGGKANSYVRDHVGAVPETEAQGSVSGNTITIVAPLTAISGCEEGGFQYQVLAVGGSATDTSPEPGTGPVPELADFPRLS